MSNATIARTVVAVLIGLPASFAELIPTAPIPTNWVDFTGTGYGNVMTLLNAHDSGGGQSDGVEANCNVIVLGSVQSSCTGVFADLTLNDPGLQNHAYSLATAGATDPSATASELRLVFNASQTGADPAITLDAIGLALWVGDTPIFNELTMLSGNTYHFTDHGVGQGGFAYKLDDAGVTAAQNAINNAIALGATLDGILVTGAFQAGCVEGNGECANDGPDSIFLGVFATVPEPASIATLGAALAAIAGIARRRRRK